MAPINASAEEVEKIVGKSSGFERGFVAEKILVGVEDFCELNMWKKSPPGNPQPVFFAGYNPYLGCFSHLRSSWVLGSKVHI